ncbi:hypothetical protein CHBEV_026 [Choristoneura biennis entomopoxvirus]|uniref:Uncharacterized protein n=1 Tax=Choristoneura biennis entomopoxvirus TaxID=10288 RepID=A0A916KPE2_CBEPV|nr:hypothetical protein CHBEV_026 [Choristoneura biennis entomopoxvirus]CCU55594.1 hypothetical protein CHBEV_026 [Choristoneura biennis entomopoxvirus]
MMINEDYCIKSNHILNKITIKYIACTCIKIFVNFSNNLISHILFLNNYKNNLKMYLPSSYKL